MEVLIVFFVLLILICEYLIFKSSRKVKHFQERIRTTDQKLKLIRALSYLLSSKNKFFTQELKEFLMIISTVFTNNNFFLEFSKAVVFLTDSDERVARLYFFEKDQEIKTYNQVLKLEPEVTKNKSEQSRNYLNIDDMVLEVDEGGVTKNLIDKKSVLILNLKYQDLNLGKIIFVTSIAGVNLDKDLLEVIGSSLTMLVLKQRLIKSLDYFQQLEAVNTQW